MVLIDLIQRDQPVLDGKLDQTGYVRNVQLVHNATAVSVYRSGRKRDEVANFGRRFTFYEQLQDLALASGQVFQRVRLYLAPVQVHVIVEDRVRDGLAQAPLSSVNDVDRLDHLVAGRFFQQVTSCSDL